MTPQEIKDNAPKGAVDYCDNNGLVVYFNKNGYVWNGFNFVIDTCWHRIKKPLN